MADCEHLWHYRNGRSECLRCPATADDERGLPHGHYAVNGAAVTATRLTSDFACPECLANILPRVVGGELKILCVGEEKHDIVELGRAMPKERRDYIVRKQRWDFYVVADGLPDELRKEMLKCVQSKA